MAELFELHNKNKFEIYGFSFGPKCDDEMTQRIKQPFKMFFEVEDLGDKQIANLSREHKIDIAIDLKGYTKDSRSGIFSYRPAPVQVNYLGYPGTTGNLDIDYIIADKTIIPKTHQHFYSEKIAYLPNSYQVNDRKRKISNHAYTKKELGLPENGFVYCCFNYNYKITPDVFDSWSRILKKVEGSVLWLLQDNEFSNNNLKNEAILRGINPNRIIYANRLELPLHLARHSSADLFLDTWPCNAHTTASDALWTALPVLTLIGSSFASRVCSSLLNAIGTPELITSSIEDYESLAVKLAFNKDALKKIKDKLIKNRDIEPLFNTPDYVKNLEKIYIEMHRKTIYNEPHDHIYVN